MRNLMLVCAGLAIVGGIVSVNLWRELRTERALTAELRQQLGASQAVLPPPAAGMPTFAPAPGSGAAATTAAPGKVETAAVVPTPGRTAPVADIANIILNQQEMMKDPEYRKARLMQTRMTLPQNYPGLIDALGLSPEEADKLFDLLAEQQLEMSDVSMLTATINGVQPDPSVMEDAMRRRQEMQRRHDEALMASLGGRHSQWQDYQQTRGARQQVVQLGRTLEAVGVPLTAEQSRPLTDAYIAEQRRQREETTQMFASLSQGGAMDQSRMMEERFKLQADSNRRILDAARPHLNAQQLSALQSSLEQQLAMNRASSRMVRQRAESGQQLPATISITTVAPPPTSAPASTF